MDTFTARAPAAAHTPPMCYFCSSTDTMEPFRRQPRLPLLSLVIRSLRWRYCRACARHFLTFRRTASRAVADATGPGTSAAGHA
jgi:hypothetical protein